MLSRRVWVQVAPTSPPLPFNAIFASITAPNRARARSSGLSGRQLVPVVT